MSIRAQDGTPEINAWVVIRPDDTVVVRVVRAEMGQGTLTGLAQLVAEELECDWSKVTTENPTPGQSVARKRVWGDFSTGGSRGIRKSHEYVRKGGATAREMLIQAAANEWKVPATECSAANSVITHKPSGRTTTYGKVAAAAGQARAAEGGEAQGSEGLEDRRQRREAARHDGQAHRQAGLRRRPEAAWDAQCRHQGIPGAGRQDAELRRRARSRACLASRRSCKSATRPSRSWRTAGGRPRPRSMRFPSSGTRAPNSKVSSATIAEWLKAGLDAPEAYVGNQNGDAKGALAGAAKKVEAVYAYPYQNHVCMEPMNATALYTADKCEVWGPTQNGEAAFAAAVAASGLPANKVDGVPDAARRRLRPARCLPGLRHASGAHRQADAGDADEAVVVARGGYGAGPLPPGHAVQAHRRLRCRQQLDRFAHPAVGAVDPRRACSRKRSRTGATRSPSRALPRQRRAFIRLLGAEPDDRPRHAQPARPARLLAWREHQPERHLHGVLHG